MSPSFQPVTSTFACEVSDVDLREPLTPEVARQIESAADDYGVLIFRNQQLSDDQQIAFSENFGTIEHAVGSNVTALKDRRTSTRIADVSNLDKNHQILAPNSRQRLFNIGNRLWHSDSSFRATPAKWSLLSARSVVSKGGNTEFADMRAAYDTLDDETKAEVDPLVCEHSLKHSRGLLGFSNFTDTELKAFTPVRQRLVRTHPATGRQSLYLSSHAGTIEGWEMPAARAFLRDLNEHATQPRFVYVHHWQLHDLVIWDNRQTMHRVRRFDETREARDMRRTTLGGDAPTIDQQAGAA
jgi:alpha-ketoglutarate-dependent 2,4-dichlorophenoxyacetate dioxygenase